MKYTNPIELFVKDTRGKPLPAICINRVVHRTQHGSYIYYQNKKIPVVPSSGMTNLYTGDYQE